MGDTFIAETSITINAEASRVWEALTTPSLIKKYLMGTTVVSDWRKGSSISYSGVYEGKEYQDKGEIIKMEPGKVFQSTYWSSMSGKKDEPENYNLVTYRLSEEDGNTVVHLTQDNITSEKEKAHSEKNWEMVLKKLKEVVENETE